MPPDSDDLDAGWEAAAEEPASDDQQVARGDDDLDAGWDAPDAPAGKRRPSRERRAKPVDVKPSAPVVRPAPAATSAKHLRRKLEREARARAKQAKAERRKAGPRAPSAPGKPLETPKPKTARPPPSRPQTRPQRQPGPERRPGAKAERPRSAKPDRPRGAKAEHAPVDKKSGGGPIAPPKRRKRPRLSMSSPIVLIGLFVLVSGVVLYFALR
jgi:hypothetical protein